MAAQQCLAAVMFADMRGFTAMAERLKPAEVFGLLNEFFAMLTSIALRHDGTVFNIAGDCLMVGFGVPTPQQESGIRALRAAREMLLGFAEVAQRWHQDFGVQTGLGIGINEGEVVAGYIGSEQNYTLIGDTVNIAARLGQRARAGEVLFSSALRVALNPAAEEEIAVRALPPLVLRGRSNPVDIFCIPMLDRLDIPH